MLFAYAASPEPGELLSGWIHAIARGQGTSIAALIDRPAGDLDWRPEESLLRLLAKGAETTVPQLRSIVAQACRAQPIAQYRLNPGRTQRWQICLRCAQSDHDRIGRTVLRARDNSVFAAACPDHACLLSEVGEEFLPRRRPTNGEVERHAFPVPDLVLQFQSVMMGLSNRAPGCFLVSEPEMVRRVGLDLALVLVSDHGSFWSLSDWVSRERLRRSTACSLAADLEALSILGATMRSHALVAAALLLCRPSAELTATMRVWEAGLYGASTRNLTRTMASPWSVAINEMTPFQLRMLDCMRRQWPAPLNDMVIAHLSRRVHMHGQLYVERP